MDPATWAAIFESAAAAFAAKVVISTVISYVISSIFTKKPKVSTTAVEQQDRLITVRQPVQPGRVIFGRVRVGGVFDFIHSTTYQQNNYVVGTLDYTIPRSNQASPLYPSAVIVETISVVRKSFDPNTESYGTEIITLSNGQQAFLQNANPPSQNLVPSAGPNPGPNEYYFDSVNQLYTFSEADEGQSVQITYKYIASATVSKYLHMVIELACHEVAEIGNIYFDDELVPLQEDGDAAVPSRLRGYIYISKHLGTTDQEADPVLMFYAPELWTSEHRLRGRAYIYVKLLRDQQKFPNGLPNITAIVKGYKPLDPRTGLRVWSDNWALCIAAYLADRDFGLGHDYDEEIDQTKLIAAANVSDEGVALASGGFEARYTCNGTFLTSEKPIDILGRMKVAGSGQVVRVGGKWRIYAGAYIVPTVEITEDHLRGPIQVRPRLSRHDLFNGVKGVYVSEANAWQPADFPAVKNSTYLAEDNGENVWLDVDYQYTTFAPTAQRLSKIELERVRQQITVILPCKLSVYKLEPPRTVMVTLAIFGWDHKVFEVSQLDLVAEVADDDAPYVGVDLTLRETTSTVWDWNSGEETTVDSAPDSNLPNPFALAPPGVPTVREEFYETAGSVGVRLQVDWAPAGDGQAEFYDVEWKLVDPDVTQFQQHPGLTSTHDTIENVSNGSYDVRVRARSRFTSSVWAQKRVEVLGLAAPLATPVIEGLQTVGGLAILSLTPHPDLRVRVGGRWRVRHTEDPSFPLWEESFSIGHEQGYPGSNNILVLPLKAGSYLVKAEGLLGQQSDGYADIQTNQASVLEFSPVDLVTEDPTFSGTHSGTLASAGVLKLDAAGAVDDEADFDAIPSLDALGGILMDGTYGFASGMNFGAITRVRLTGHLEGITVNELDLIDSRGAPIDDWLDFDGTGGGGAADAWIEMRQTDDDPTGAPTWGVWKRLDSSEVVCWGLQFRLRIVTIDPAYNKNITAVSVNAEELV